VTRRLTVTLCLSFCAVLAVSACAGEPWVDTRREAGSLSQVGESTPDRVAICHAGDADRATLEAMANRECAKTGRTAHYVSSTRFQCRLVTPHRSFFACR